MQRIRRGELVLVGLLGVTLFVGALVVVDVRFDLRQTFVAHERELDVERRLQDDRAELEMKVRRASLPGAIVAGAREMGMLGATGDNTVTLDLLKDGTVTLSDETRRRIEAEARRRAGAEDKRTGAAGRNRP